MKYWINELPGNDKLIIWDGNKIYKGNPGAIKLREFDDILKKGEIPAGLFSIPKSHMKKIEMDESRNYICVYFGASSYEHFRVTDMETRKDIFNTLSDSENAVTSVKELTLSEKTKNQRKAFIVLTILFILGLFFSAMIESGALPDGKYPVILLFLGGLGVKNITLVYLIVISLIGIRFYLLSKTQRIIHTLIFE